MLLGLLEVLLGLLEVLLDVLEMLLEVLELSWRSWAWGNFWSASL